LPPISNEVDPLIGLRFDDSAPDSSNPITRTHKMLT
jgi:hypothetical protein